VLEIVGDCLYDAERGEHTRNTRLEGQCMYMVSSLGHIRLWSNSPEYFDRIRATAQIWEAELLQTTSCIVNTLLQRCNVLSLAKTPALLSIQSRNVQGVGLSGGTARCLAAQSWGSPRGREVDIGSPGKRKRGSVLSSSYPATSRS
jgi:hypothetical protein